MNKGLKISLLNYSQYDSVSYFDKNDNNNAKATDFAVLLGARVDDFGYCQWWCQNQSFPYPDSMIYLRIQTIAESGFDDWCYADSIKVATRPVLKYSQVKYFADKSITYNYDNKYFAFEFGEYPQTIVRDEKLSAKLDKLYENNLLKETGKTYTTDIPYEKAIYGCDDKNFEPFDHIEYECDGRKFIRFKIDDLFENAINFKYLKIDWMSTDYVWVEVQSITWLVDLSQDLAVAANALIGGISFIYDNFNNINPDNPIIDFDDTSIYQYLNTYFVKDMLPFSLNNYKINSYNDTISKKFK